MQIIWHGREGANGKDKGIFRIHIQAAIAGKPMGLDGKPGASAVPGKDIKLLPGINDGIDPLDWAEAKKNDVVKFFLRKKFLEEVQLETLAELDPDDAAEMVKLTIDKPLLAKWRAAEKRKPVKEAIDEHLERLTPKPAAETK